MLVRDPNDVSFVLMKAHNALLSGRYRHSVGLYHHAMRLRPDLPIVHLCLAVTYLQAVFNKNTGGQRHRPVALAFACLGNYRAARLGIGALPNRVSEADGREAVASADADVEAVAGPSGSGDAAAASNSKKRSAGDGDDNDGSDGSDGDGDGAADEQEQPDPEEADGDAGSELDEEFAHDVNVTTEGGQIVVSGDVDEDDGDHQAVEAGVGSGTAAVGGGDVLHGIVAHSSARLVHDVLSQDVLTQEIEYNNGRAYHQVGCLVLAVDDVLYLLASIVVETTRSC